ncbi:hypothetical protein PsYK624_086150 [Phanerochaete sordida]|uniref:DNA 3'-5' helicase n=1 Tax=Phanerochaete sordida TaxID=48140 RepID=A0A9P3GCX2_9APHY|nr:hypothetical protein PsYK624_086150 [Phanerochaete sordida]
MAPIPQQDSTESDWHTRFKYDWQTSAGHARLRELAEPRLSFSLGDFQVKNTCRLLMGQDVVLVSATGDGKTALAYVYAMARPDTITVVVSPTNALESDMVKNFEKLGISAVALNSESLTRADLAQPPRDLWREINDRKHQAIFISPELLGDSRFRAFLQNKDVRPWLALLVIDEAHLVDEWGKDFREAYRRIKDARPWFPEWTTALALTATLEPGAQTDRVVEAIGFRTGFHLERRDCARYNVDIVLRRIEHSYTTSEFRDLDWLIPADTFQAADIEKTLLYCETIDLGHRVARYLRTLLPPSLSGSGKYKVIRHMHSMNCPSCKEEGLASLYQTGDERETGIHVTTDVLGTGMNMADFDRVICLLTPSSAAAAIQRIGRTSRGRDRHGTAYIYLKKSDVEAVEVWLHQTKLDDMDPRLLRTPALPSVLQSDAAKTMTAKSGYASRSSKNSSQLCPSLRLIIAAHVLGACISRQINIIYQNPNTTVNCGRCSSCVPRSVPLPRPLPAPLSPCNPTSPMQASAPHPNSSSIAAAADDPKVFAWQKLTAKDIAEFSTKLECAAYRVRRRSPRTPDFICVGYKSFLSQPFIQLILADFHLVATKEVLHERMKDWPYWETAGNALWDEVDALRTEARTMLEARHAEKLEKDREKRAEDKPAFDAAEETESFDGTGFPSRTPSQSDKNIASTEEGR